MQANLLKGKIVAAGYTQTSLAKALNMSANTLSSKINGRFQFNSDEIISLCELLSINDNDEKVSIFLQ